MSALPSMGVGRPLADALAEELVLAAQMLGELAFELGSDTDTLRRHMTALQKIDLVTQMQLAVVDMLRLSTDCEDALTMVTLEETAQRLRDTMARRAAVTVMPVPDAEAPIWV